MNSDRFENSYDIQYKVLVVLGFIDFFFSKDTLLHIRSQRERKKMIDPRGEKLNETGMIKGNQTEIGERSPILRLKTGWMANERDG